MEMKQQYTYEKEDNLVWEMLLKQQLPLVRKVACLEYIEGLEKLDLPLHYIPSISEMSEKLVNMTGWILEPVDILVPNRVFFNMLSQRKFPVVRVIRKREEIDFYTNESPDVFHEYFGHCPMLTNPLYASCLREFGLYAGRCDGHLIERLAKIFWATFEFGLIRNSKGIKIYGAGILPSRSEVERVMTEQNVNIKYLNIFSDLDSSLQGNISQLVYYYIDNLEDLYEIIRYKLSSLIEEESVCRTT